MHTFFDFYAFEPTTSLPITFFVKRLESFLRIGAAEITVIDNTNLKGR